MISTAGSKSMWTGGKDDSLSSKALRSSAPRCIAFDNLNKRERPHFLEIVITVQVVPPGHLDLLTKFSLREAHPLISDEVVMTSHGPLGTTHMDWPESCEWMPIYRDCFAEIN